MKRQVIKADVHSMMPFSCLFLSAIVFGGVLRLLETYIMVTSTLDGFMDIWIGRSIGWFSMGDIVAGCGLLFLLLSIYEVVAARRSVVAWMTLAFCVLLMCYTAGLRYFPEEMMVM